MAELYPSDGTLNALAGDNDAEQEVRYPDYTADEPHYTPFYKMLQRLLKVARRGGDLRVFKDGALTFGVRAGKWYNGDTAVNYSQANAQALTDNQTNYIYLTAAGVLTVNTTGFPVPSVTPYIPLATIVTASGDYDGRDLSEGGDVTDYRGRGIFQICGASSGSLNALDWQESVADELDFTAAEPAAPTLGDRYLNTGTGASSVTGQTVAANDIEEWNGTSWTEITPTEGTCCLVEDRDMLIGFNGAVWIDLGTFANIKDLTDGGNADALHVHDTAGLEDEAVTWAKANQSLLGRPVGREPHQCVKKEHILHNLPCDVPADWSEVNGTKSADTDYCHCGKTNFQSIRMVATANGSRLRYDFDQGGGERLDLTDGAGNLANVIVVRFYIHDAGGGIVAWPLSADSNIKVSLWENGFANQMSAYPWLALNGAGNAAGDLPGFYEIAIPAQWFTPAGSKADMSAIRYLDITGMTPAGELVGWTLDEVVVFRPPNTTAICAVRFDSTYDEMLEIGAYYHSLGLRITIGITPNNVGSGGYLTLDDLRQLQRWGHEIVHYPRYSPLDPGANHWRDKTAEQKDDAIAYGLDYFRKNGLNPDGARILNIPGLSCWTSADEEAYKGKYGICESGKDLLNSSRLTTLWNPSRLDICYFIDDAVLSATFKVDYIIPAQENNLVMIIGSHGHTANEIAANKSLADLLAEAVVSGSMKNMTLGEIYGGRPSGNEIERLAVRAWGAIDYTGRPADQELLTINGRKYEMDSDGSGGLEGGGDVSVDLSGNATSDDDYTDIAAAINGDSTATVTAVADTTNDILWLYAREPGSGGNSITVVEALSNATPRAATLRSGADAARPAIVSIRHTVTANDATEGHLRFNTGLASVESVHVTFEDAGVEDASKVTVGVSGGIITLDEGATAWANNDVLNILVIGTR